MIRRFFALLILLALIAAACGSGTSEGEVVAGSGSTDASVSDSDANAPDDGGDSSAPDASGDSTAPSVADGAESMSTSSPIGAFFDGGFDDAVAEYTQKVEESILVCMAAQGFEFAVSESGRQNPVEQAQNELTTRQWTEQYGFGISTSFDSLAEGQATDPNAEIIFGLSAAEREIWIQTLTGDTGLGGIGGDFGSRPLEEQGCIGQALIDTGGAEAIEGLDEIGDLYAEGEESLFDTREMVEAIDAWSRCMSQVGYPNYASLDDPEDEVSSKLSVITAPLNEAIDGLSDEEGQALVSGESLDIEALPGLDVDALRSPQADEIDLAIADLDCYQVEVQAIYEPLRDDFERGLLEEYADEFNALRTIGS